ncbi:Uncharacterised protein [Shewanella putrefaciens]|nr:Uncharacterised protein [Shewanella putrefaciens]
MRDTVWFVKIVVQTSSQKASMLDALGVVLYRPTKHFKQIPLKVILAFIEK